MNNKYLEVCSNCVMDSTANGFRKSETGCNYCDSFKKDLNTDAIFDKGDLSKYVDSLKEKSKHSIYDCIVGVSGGIDSSMVLIKAKEIGLNPLAVHMDNGLDSELAQNNINNLIRTLGVDLITYVINWNEYRMMMDELFNADVIDVELLYDNAMLAVNYQFANRFGIKTILSGMNTSTEGMQMPTNWNWFKYDQRHIKYFKSKIKQSIKSTFPSIGTNEFLYYTYVKKIKWEHFLDFFNYKKEDSLQELEKNYGYKRYPYKHYESVFTRFYQGYILPKKFGVDKRKLHLSTLIVTGQATREECAIILENAPYDEFELIQDINYFLKKMKWSQVKLDEYLNRKEISHSNYPSEKNYWETLIELRHKLL